MSLTISEVIDQAGSQDIAYVNDEPMHYIVLTRKDNTFDTKWVQKYMATLD